MRASAWDLEGPLSATDFAAEICKLLPSTGRVPQGSEDFDQLFLMLSNYDDYLVDEPGVKESLGVGEYEPGDTLRLLAPLYVHAFTSEQLRQLSEERVGLIPGAKETVQWLMASGWNPHVISTSYEQHALTVAAHLGLPADRVYCTLLPVEELKGRLDQEELSSRVDLLVNEIFSKYKRSGNELSAVIDDLNDFFWGPGATKSSYRLIMDSVKVRGGRRKELAVEDVSRRTGVPISRFVATGDSITDVHMLSRVSAEGGVAISFNGNAYTVSRANVAVTSPNLRGVQAILEHSNEPWSFLAEWDDAGLNKANDPSEVPRGLVSDELREYLCSQAFVPRLWDLRNLSDGEKERVTADQKEMRSKVRGWVGQLG